MGVGATKVDGEATVVVTMAPLDLVGNRCLGLVFIMVPVSLGLVGSSIPVKVVASSPPPCPVSNSPSTSSPFYSTTDHSLSMVSVSP
ncbi:hypothetical protein H0E87_023994, partial [Populus deltoides]